MLRLDESDLTWSGVSTLLWALAEPSVAILVACAPVFSVFFDGLSPKRIISRLTSLVSSHQSSNTRQRIQEPPLLENGLNTPLTNQYGSHETRDIELSDVVNSGSREQASPKIS